MKQMICPFCGNEMEKGGLTMSGRDIYKVWYPEAEFEKKKTRIWPGKGEVVIRRQEGRIFEEKYPDSYLCRNCRKVIGIFDIEND